MTLLEYHDLALLRAIYPDIGNNISYPVLGLCGEAGEVAEKVKKALRDNNGVLDDETKMMIAKELGDVLWYIAAIASEIGTDLNEIAAMNLDKVNGRHLRGTIRGSGDDR